VGATAIGRPPGSLPTPRATRELAWLVTLLVMLSVVAFVLGLLAFVNEPPASRLRGELTALTHRVDALEAQLRGQTHALTLERRRRLAAERKAQSALATLRAASDVTASAADLNALHGSVYRLAQCVSQLEQQLAAIRVQTTDTGGWLTGVTLTRPAPPPACTRATG
jgi:polyhydroxyalkanoate synthesis regulator phasin